MPAAAIPASRPAPLRPVAVAPAPHTDPVRPRRGPFPPSAVCGIDVGSLRTPAYVAWLRQGEFVLDLHLPSAESPLPIPPPGWPAPEWVGLDAPQGLPAPGQTARACDREAGTPTRRLPADRRELAASILYKGLVQAGVEVFWALYEQGLVRIAGLPAGGPDRLTTVCETYPRHVLRRLWPDLRPIPSKRRVPVDYVEAVWARLRDAGYTCPSVVRPTVDQVDAMLCALAAEAGAREGGLPAGTVGEPPAPDYRAEVLREGLIVAP